MSETQKYSIVTGFFAQDDPNANPDLIGPLPPRFGLLDQAPDYWSRFISRLSKMNQSAPKGVAYKVFFLGRHGEGYHNVAEARYGTKAWDKYWSKLYGDSEITWGPDPLLTPIGIRQAEAARSIWLMEIEQGIPVPERCFVSPLHRALSTWEITFGGDTIFQKDKKRVTILENLREEYGVHTCDMRDPRSMIERAFPSPVYIFEPGFTEEDLSWEPDERETKDHVRSRGMAVLNHVFQQFSETCISITAHSGIINGILAAMGRSRYGLPTGGMLPLVIRGEGL